MNFERKLNATAPKKSNNGSGVEPPKPFSDVGGTFTSISIPGTLQTFANGINDLGQIAVGYLFLRNTVAHNVHSHARPSQPQKYERFICLRISGPLIVFYRYIDRSLPMPPAPSKEARFILRRAPRTLSVIHDGTWSGCVRSEILSIVKTTRFMPNPGVFVDRHVLGLQRHLTQWSAQGPLGITSTMSFACVLHEF